MKRNKINNESMKNAYDGLLKTFIAKNKDYGNSFEQSLDTHGLVASVVRMEDKFNRLKSLVGRENEAQVASESLTDTLLDLANYATMTAVYLEGEKDFDSTVYYDPEDFNQLYPKILKNIDNKLKTGRFAKFSSILNHKRVDPLFVIYKEEINTNYYFFPTLRVDDDGLKFFTISHDLNIDAVSFLVTGNQQYFVSMLNHINGHWDFDNIVTEYPVNKTDCKGTFMIDSLKLFTNNRWRALNQFGNRYSTIDTKDELESYDVIAVDHKAFYPVYEDLNKIEIIYNEKEFLYDIIGNYVISDRGYYRTYQYHNGLIKDIKPESYSKPTEDIINDNK